MATLTAVNRLCCVTNTKEPENWKSLKRRLAKKSEFHFTTGICKLPKESKKWHFFFFSYRFSPYKLGYSCFHKPNRLYYLLLSLDLENWKSLDLMLAVSKQNKSSEARGKPPKDCQRTKEVMRNDTKDYFFVCCTLLSTFAFYSPDDGALYSKNVQQSHFGMHCCSELCSSSSPSATLSRVFVGKSAPNVVSFNSSLPPILHECLQCKWSVTAFYSFHLHSSSPFLLWPFCLIQFINKTLHINEQTNPVRYLKISLPPNSHKFAFEKNESDR